MPSLTDSIGDTKTINLERALHFPTRGGDEVTASPGAYFVDLEWNDHLRLTSLADGKVSTISASNSWHELKVTSPVAVIVPVHEHEEQIVMLLPSGRALQTVGSSVRGGSIGGPHRLVTKDLAEAILKRPWITRWGFSQDLSFNPLQISWGTIDPSPFPSEFRGESVPPNWVGATVARCDVPRAGSYAPLGPGTASGEVPFPPGMAVNRGKFPGYTVSVTPVTVTSSLHLAGRAVQLLVTNIIVSNQFDIIDMFWTDVYQIVPTTNGPVIFQDVIVATGRFVAPGYVAKFLTPTDPSEVGTPTDFELRINGFTIATKTCRFTGGFPNSPHLFC